MRKTISVVFVLLCATMIVFAQGGSETASESKPIVMKYAHMNPPDNLDGQYAQYFADKVNELTNGEIVVEVYPNSQLGTLQEQVEMLSAGTIQFHHTTWGALSALYQDVEVLDTPYLCATVEDSIKLNDIKNSPIMQKFDQALQEKANVKILCSIYGGSRMLTCTFPVYSPADLKGVKVRALPSPVYITAVEGMGAIPVAIDWADTPTALATGVAQGQENPPSTTYNAKLQESQDYIMETRHIMATGPILMNSTAFNSLSPEHQKAIEDAAYDTWEKYNQIGIDSESEYIEKLCDEGMTFITADDGLKVDEFKKSVDALVAKTYAQYEPYYEEISEFLGY